MIGVSDEHTALHAAVRGWADRHAGIDVARLLIDGPNPPAALPDGYWSALADQGWLATAVGTEAGGQGAGLAELVVVIEELAYRLAPGPVAETALVAHLADRYGGDPGQGLARAIVAGDASVAVTLEPITGDQPFSPIANLAVATHLLHPTAGRGMADRPRASRCRRADQEPRPHHPRRPPHLAAGNLGHGWARLRPLSHPEIPSSSIWSGAEQPRDLLAIVLGAEALGLARWCLDTAAEHARTREQFGRPIGQFQAIKHRCADMAVALELARAAVWDATRGALTPEEAHLAAGAAGALAPEAALGIAKDTIQILGGIGFTWEHDAHLYLRRAVARCLQVGSSAGWRRSVAECALAGSTRTQRLDLPPEAEDHRLEVRAFLDELRDHPSHEWNRRIAGSGYLVPHWPEPHGRDAEPLEQLVVDEEFRGAGIRRPHLQVGAWVLPTLIEHGTHTQQERWIGPTLRFEISWCQLFSEPGAGSDLASLTTRAIRADGGWLVTGQKVWTSMAADADWGILLARTDPDRPKHDGITCFCLDMSTDGIDIRPLRELTGMAMFNEVFLDEVFVPDDCVVGEVDDGWRAGRTTLANERVSMGSGASIGPGVASVLASLGEQPTADALATVGGLVAESLALTAMGTRATMRALSGALPGPEASIRKLAGVEHDQRVQEVGLLLQGAAGLADEGDAAQWVNGFLWNRCLTIAGGTSEIQRNIIAERLLDLPRDP